MGKKKLVYLLCTLLPLVFLSGCSRFPTQGVPGVASANNSSSLFFLLLLSIILVALVIKIIKNSKPK